MSNYQEYPTETRTAIEAEVNRLLPSIESDADLRRECKSRNVL